jgi:hypothetical protein
MASELPPPDLAIWICPDRHAPRAARYCVATIEPPPPDLRDLVVLLTSELVSRTVRLRPLDSRDLVELRVWARRDLSRVELRGPHELVCAPLGIPNRGGGDLLLDDLELVEALSDRWSIDADEHAARIWFEIDGRIDAGARDAQHARPRRFDGVGLDNTRHRGASVPSTHGASGWSAARASRHRCLGVAARAWRSNRSRR